VRLIPERPDRPERLPERLNRRGGVVVGVAPVEVARGPRVVRPLAADVALDCGCDGAAACAAACAEVAGAVVAVTVAVVAVAVELGGMGHGASVAVRVICGALLAAVLALCVVADGLVAAVWLGAAIPSRRAARAALRAFLAARAVLVLEGGAAVLVRDGGAAVERAVGRGVVRGVVAARGVVRGVVAARGDEV